MSLTARSLRKARPKRVNDGCIEGITARRGLHEGTERRRFDRAFHA
jgi:hypothetical protein